MSTEKNQRKGEAEREVVVQYDSYQPSVEEGHC